MNAPHSLRYVFSACVAAVNLVGCSGLPTQNPGIANQNASQAARPETSNPTALAISNSGPSVASVAVLNNVFKPAYAITSGLVQPRGDWIDTNESVYVADYNRNAVLEYLRSKTVPYYTYTGYGMADTVNVTTDKADHVYAVDDTGGTPSAPNLFEFKQHVAMPIATCGTGMYAYNAGVAVDRSRDVFVSYNYYGSSGHLLEYASGLSGCHGTALGVTLSIIGGLQVDKSKNLIVADYGAGTVDTIAPLYTAVSGVIPGFVTPANVALNEKENLLFVADPGAGVVDVVRYPSGAPVTTLGSANGATAPVGVAAYPCQLAGFSC